MREVRMTFGEHLEELRWRIILALLWATGGIVVAFIYGQELMELALGPHYSAISGQQRDRHTRRLTETARGLEPLMGMNPQEARIGEGRVIEGPIRWEVLFPFGERLGKAFNDLASRVGDQLESLPAAERQVLADGLRGIGKQLSRTLEVTGAGAVPVRFKRLEAKLRKIQQAQGSEAEEMIGWSESLNPAIESLARFNSFLDKRGAEAMESDVDLETFMRWSQESKLDEGLKEEVAKMEESARALETNETPRIMVISYIESFSMYLRVSIIFGLLFTTPFILYEMWKFVGAGLHLHEQRYVVSFLPFSIALFVAGMVFGYFGMIPVGLRFLAGWGTENYDLHFTLGNYIGLFLTLTLILGLVFQTPLVMVFLHKLGIMTVETFKRYRRVAVFVGVCLAVVLTPPDPFSWALMAGPMILLYELGIIVCRLMSRNVASENTP